MGQDVFAISPSNHPIVKELGLHQKNDKAGNKKIQMKKSD